MKPVHVEGESLVFRGPRQLDFEKRTIADIGDSQLLVRNELTMISPGTEVARYTGTHIGLRDPNNTYAKYPFYPGYSAVGEVIEVGRLVDGVKPADVIYHFGKHAKYDLLDTTGSLHLPIPRGLPKENALVARFGPARRTTCTTGLRLVKGPSAAPRRGRS